MRLAMERAGWDSFKERLRHRTGRPIRGIGLATYIEACAGGGAKGRKSHREGRLGDRPHRHAIDGAGARDGFCPARVGGLDLPPDRVRVVQGDTDLVKTGGGTGGSRSIPVGGASVAGASKTLAEKLKSLAAEALEAGAADLEIADGAVRIAGTDRSMDFAAIAALPQATPEALTATDAWAPPEYTYPNGTHVCELEIDPDTGTV